MEQGWRPEFLSPRARENRCFSMCRTALALRSTGRKRHAIRSRRGGRLVQWTAGRRRSRRDSELIVKTSPRFTVNWPALASFNPRRLGTRFYKSEVRSDLASAERAGSAGKHCSPRARGDKNSRSSKVLDDTPPAQRDAPIVARLRAAGAVLIGRTNMTEFAFSGVGINPHYGTPGNPYDRRLIPGGSSSGAAVSVSDG